MVAHLGITPEHDNPLIFATPTPLGEEKGILAKCAAVVLCCRLLSRVDRGAGRAGQRMQCWSSGLFPHPISGIVMSNQNAVRYLGTLQPPHYSVRLALILVTARDYTLLPEYRIAAVDNAFCISTAGI